MVNPRKYKRPPFNRATITAMDTEIEALSGGTVAPILKWIGAITNTDIYNLTPDYEYKVNTKQLQLLKDKLTENSTLLVSKGFEEFNNKDLSFVDETLLAETRKKMSIDLKVMITLLEEALRLDTDEYKVTLGAG